MSSSDLKKNEKNDSENLNRPHDDIDTNKGIIAWFARNTIAANLLMVFILIGGGLTALTINKQMFPQLEFNWISYAAPYPGPHPKRLKKVLPLRLRKHLNQCKVLSE